jgi:NTE family protein
VALEDNKDFQSLRRFLVEEAIGFVAGGGGAFGPAHVGIYKALRESGFVFDIFGGSSVGSGMAAGFSLLMEPEAIEAAVHEIFVKSRAFKRFILPKYSLLDHTALDQALQRLYGSTPIEDVWKPYFAVATDLSENALRVIRTGPLWRAVRASSSIPGVLPPVFDEEGHMLADGAIADNVPLGTMKSLKAGPNVVVDIAIPERCLFDVDYRSIPGRWGLLNRLMNPFSRRELPRCPSPASVIQRSIFTTIRKEPQPTGPHDLFLRPPPLPGSDYMNWDRHHDVFDAAYQWGLETLDRLKADNDPAIGAMERALTGANPPANGRMAEA